MAAEGKKLHILQEIMKCVEENVAIEEINNKLLLSTDDKVKAF
jgi:hypothetical protein